MGPGGRGRSASGRRHRTAAPGSGGADRRWSSAGGGRARPPGRTKRTFSADPSHWSLIPTTPNASSQNSRTCGIIHTVFTRYGIHGTICETRPRRRALVVSGSLTPPPDSRAPPQGTASSQRCAAGGTAAQGGPAGRAGRGERNGREKAGARRVGVPSGNHKVVRRLLLKHPPHALDEVARVAPVAHRVEVPAGQGAGVWVSERPPSGSRVSVCRFPGSGFLFQEGAKRPQEAGRRRAAARPRARARRSPAGP